MDGTDDALAGLRDALIASLRSARSAERELFARLDPGERDAAIDGGWSAKDTQAHLSAWRRRQADRLAARRDGRPEPEAAGGEIDAINAGFHAERADWSWERVVDDAEATTEALIGGIAAADADTIHDPRRLGAILGDGAEHSLEHLGPIAARSGAEDRVLQLAAEVEALVDDDGLPSRPKAFTRYNLACLHAKAGRLDRARDLLRLALPAEAELREHAATDDDLAALRHELPALGG